MKQHLTQEKKHEIIIQKYGSNFCAAPFNSLHEGPDGLVSTCCKTREPIGNSKEQTFTEMYNSEHIKNVRRQFLLNQKPKQCQSCWVQESSGRAANNRSFSNASGFETIDEVVANTDPDGTVHVQKPGWLDLLWTNKCNFACLGCSPELSTTIAKNHKKSFSILNGVEYPEIADDSIQWKNNNHAKIDYILKHRDSIKMIHLNGGEPFLSDDIFELLDVLLANGLHKTIKIWSHTNGSVTHSYKGVDIVNEYLVHWGENASITMSNDGNGLRGEYIRYGYRDKKWLETYLKIKEAKIKLNIQTCLNVFNGLAMEEIGQWLLDNCTHKGQAPFGSLTLWTNDSTNIRLYNFDPEVKERAIRTMQNLLISKQCPVGWERHLMTHVTWINPKIMPDIDHARKFYNGTISLDTERGTSFDTAFPELIEFRNNIKKII